MGLRSGVLNFYNGSSWQTLCAALIDNTKGSGAVGSGISINTSGTAAPDASAILDLSSTSLGLLVPRMTSAQRDAVKTPAQGLIIYNNTNNRIEHWTGAAWYEWLTGTPAAPLASDATSETCSSFYALWNILGGSVGATTYYLDVNTNNTFTGTWIKNNVNVGLVTNYNVTGLSMSTTYYYRVRAYNACGTSTSSNTATGTTTAAPAAPTANAATMFATDGSAFTANWTSTGATNYYLDVNTNSTFTGTWIKNNANVGNVTTYNVTGLSPNTTYYYRVRAFGCSTTSASSNTITVLTCQGATVTSSTICSGTTSVTTYTVTVAGYVSECTWPDNCNSNSSCVVIWAAVGYSVTYNAFDHTSCPSGAGGACGIYSNNSGKSISAACRP